MRARTAPLPILPSGDHLAPGVFGGVAHATWFVPSIVASSDTDNDTRDRDDHRTHQRGRCPGRAQAVFVRPDRADSDDLILCWYSPLNPPSGACDSTHRWSR